MTYPSDKNPDNLFQDLEFVSDEHDNVNKDNKGAAKTRSQLPERRPVADNRGERQQPGLFGRALGV
jgi:hypothetical protein